MNTALRTHDLIREIFSHLHVYGPEGGVEDFYSGAGTLYNAALSCKRFSSHALDALWFTLYDLAPLMRLVPNSEDKLDAGICLTRPLKKGDLLTFDRYAKRIKEYHEFADSEFSTRYRVAVMLDLLQCLNRHHLLPNLRELYTFVTDMRREWLDFNSFLLCPSLRYLNIAFNGGGHIEFVFPRIVQLAPHLRRFEIMDDNVSIPEYLLSLIGEFHSLQELSTSNDFVLSSGTFSSTFSFADQLKIWRLASIAIDPRDLSKTQSLGSTGHQFSALTELELQYPKSIEAISQVFAHNLFPRLEILVIRVRKSTDGSNCGWAKLFSALFPTKNCLQCITIYQWGDNASYHFTPGDIDIFAPLENSGPQDLKELIVQLPLRKSLPTLSIRTLVGVFPRLTSLQFATSQILFSDLVLLAEGLPHLHELWIGVDGRMLPRPNDPPTFPLLSHGLKILVLHNSDIGNPAVFARWLDRLFPVVWVSRVGGSPNVPEMASILASMRPIREDQEARIQQKIG